MKYNARYRWLLLAAVVGLTAYYFLPQLGEVDDIVESLRDIQLGWLAAAVVASMATYAMASLTVIGSTARHLPWHRALIVQIASTVLNRITPKGIGTAAMTERYLEKNGCGRAEAIAAVSIIYATGAMTHVSLLVAVFLLVEPAPQGMLALSPQQIALSITIATLGLASLVTIPRLRRPVLRWAVELRSGLRLTAAHPLKLLQLFGGSVGITICFALALYCSMMGLDVTLPFGTIVLIYLGSGVAGLASPAPGGLTAAGVPAGQAISGVLVYRLASFWFPILPGLIALRYVTRHKMI